MVALLRSLVLVVLLSILSMFSLMFVGVDDMHMGHGCPFMTHDSICPMDAFEHISAATTAVIQTVVTVLVVGGAVLLLKSAFSQCTLVRLRILAPPEYEGRRYRYDARCLQSMFARGILNPKVH